MLIDARQIDQFASITSDICIIGAGAAGITMALQLSGKEIESSSWKAAVSIQMLRPNRSMPERMSD